MVGGVALIGTLAGTLGSFFSGGGDEDLESTTVDQATDPAGALSVQEALLAEVKSMRAEIAEMRLSATPSTRIELATRGFRSLLSDDVDYFWPD